MISDALIILPAYNESELIQSVIRKIKESISIEVLVINDKSQDNTAKLAKEAGAIVINHPINMGYGVAIQTGYKYALQNDYQYLVQMDADGQHDPQYIKTLLDVVRKGDCDLAIGSRFLGAGDYKMEPLRRLGQQLFGYIASKVLKEDVTDPTSGFQAMNRRVICFFSNDFFPCDYPDADVIIMAHYAGIRTKEVPVVMYRSVTGQSIHSGLKPVYYVFKMFLSIFTILITSKSIFRKKFSEN